MWFPKSKYVVSFNWYWSSYPWYTLFGSLKNPLRFNIVWIIYFFLSVWAQSTSIMCHPCCHNFRICGNLSHTVSCIPQYIHRNPKRISTGYFIYQNPTFKPFAQVKPPVLHTSHCIVGFFSRSSLPFCILVRRFTICPCFYMFSK